MSIVWLRNNTEFTTSVNEYKIIPKIIATSLSGSLPPLLDLCEMWLNANNVILKSKLIRMGYRVIKFDLIVILKQCKSLVMFVLW